MRKLILFVLLIVGATSAYSQTPEAEKVNNLHKKKFEWLTSKNYDSLNWLVDESVKFIHSTGWTQSKKDIMDDLKSGKLNYTSIVVQESSVSIHNNQSAVVTGKGNFKGLMVDKTEFNVNLLYTEVYVKSKKQWKLVSRHACKI